MHVDDTVGVKVRRLQAFCFGYVKKNNSFYVIWMSGCDYNTTYQEK
jgi:hypothetical protein